MAASGLHLACVPGSLFSVEGGIQRALWPHSFTYCQFSIDDRCSRTRVVQGMLVSAGLVVLGSIAGEGVH